MTVQTPTIAVPAARRGPGRRRGLGLAVGALVAVAAGIGLRQVGRDGGATDPASPPATAVERTVAPRPAEAETTVYVVGSPEQAEATRAGLAEADAVRAQLAQSPLAYQVVVVADGEADAFFRMMGEQDAVRAQLGLPSLVVDDLRAAGGATVPSVRAETGGCGTRAHAAAC